MAGTARSNSRSSSPSPLVLSEAEALGRGLGGAHVLVIRLSAMGDVAMMVPVLLAFRRNYPEVEITLLTKPHFKPIFRFIQGVTVFSADVKSKHKGVFGLWKLYLRLKHLSITHVADLHNVLRSTILGFFFGLNGIPVKKVDKGRIEKRKLTRKHNKVFSPLKSTIERYTEVFEALGFPMDTEIDAYLPKQSITPGLQKFVDPEFKKIIGIAPFATYPSKMYRLEVMKEVIQQLISSGNYKILLFGGGEKETQQLKKLESSFGNQVESIAGKLSLEEELILISNLDVMLAMDSGNGHLAANYGVPVITLWGVTHPYAGFIPYKQSMENSLLPDREAFPLIPTSVYGNKYPIAYREAINTIAPNHVAQKVLDVLLKS